MKPLDGRNEYAHQRRMTDNNHDNLIEISAILGAGLLRVLKRKSSRNLLPKSENALDCGLACRGDVQAESKDIGP